MPLPSHTITVLLPRWWCILLLLWMVTLKLDRRLWMLPSQGLSSSCVPIIPCHCVSFF
jgi:hypothetical protein